MSEITRLSAGGIVAALRDGTLSARDVLDAFVARIEAYNGRVNAIVQLDLEAARDAAVAVDKARAAGTALGPLAGVPVAIKDGFDVQGFRTTYGAAALRDNRAEVDAAHVARLRAAGAIIVGKTNLPEFAFAADTDNALYGRTRNPYALDRTPGSSSGGAGAALAMDFVPLADGSDLGGSSRLPAAWCNTVGYRPSAGVIPMVPSPAPYDRLHVIGPMARRVEDIRLFLSVTAGAHPASPLTCPAGPADFAAPLSGNLSGIRIAMSLASASFKVDPAVTLALAPCAGVLEQAGATVGEDDPDIAFLARSQPLFRAFCAAEYAGWAADEHGLELGHDILDLVGQSRRLSGFEIERAHLAKAKAWTKLTAFFERYDLICWPTIGAPPFLAEQARADAGWADSYDWGPLYVSPALDLPSISVPGGFTQDGLPTGLQIVGRPGSDRLVLEAAEAVERGLKVWEKNPPRLSLQPVG